ncbi:LysR family transcriptional regulator [Methylovirgula sp. 4M-Z18]|uniref:LysR family transcriptional regulator n=1 Tax=Methylovirgula sp. 4M-Z18 TaxID=2293567 RepID=UPI000E2F5ED3|nr:LysR family transcriptional regulator [Methylovirgula sp. 4M-Z18]RFB80908.1 LysR family transcriptional regulator [Methylovirgula sp. 4M-Z18]
MSLLENIQAFVRTIELGSLSAAGRQLRQSPAVMSHRLQQLEAHLGVRLVNRTTRRLQLTEQGLVFFENARVVLETLERAESVVSDVGATPRGNLKVTAPLVFGRCMLAPLVPSFLEKYPHVSIRLRLSDHLLDLLSEGVDMAVRLAIMPDSSLIARKIADCPRVLCASPEYLAARGTPETPEDLFGHNCLLLRFPGSQQFRWTIQSGDGPLTLSVQGRADADDGDVLTQWALAGQGIALKSAFEIADALRDGRLVPVLPQFPPLPATLSVVYPHKRLMPARVKLFADFLVQEISPLIQKAHEGLDHVLKQAA